MRRDRVCLHVAVVATVGLDGEPAEGLVQLRRAHHRRARNLFKRRVLLKVFIVDAGLHLVIDAPPLALAVHKGPGGPLGAVVVAAREDLARVDPPHRHQPAALQSVQSHFA